MNSLDLPDLESYSSDVWQELEAYSPAVRRYRPWLDELRRSSLLTQSGTPFYLHQTRTREWIKAALATWTQRLPDSDICRSWSATADLLFKKAWQDYGLSARPIVIYALGKWGAEELNLSSDIDLIVFAPKADIEWAIPRLRSFVSELNQVGERGFLYRTDFDLRPGGKRSPLITPIEEIESYYGSLGQTWERMAWLRARAIFGPRDLVNQIDQFMSRFCYRKYLDLLVMDDLKSMRQRIGLHHPSSKGRIEIKHQVGGIRDIELFVQSLLLIHGGRNPTLRSCNINKLIERLVDSGILGAEDGRLVQQCYWNWRHFENLAQIQNDQQVYHLDEANPFYQKLRPMWLEKSKLIDELISELLGRISPKATSVMSEALDAHVALSPFGELRSQLEQPWGELVALTRSFVRSDSDDQRRVDFLRSIIGEIAKHANDPILALNNLSAFMRSVRAKSGFFSLIQSTPPLARDLATLFGFSPYLGTILSSRPDLLDSFLLRRDEASRTDPNEFFDSLAERRLLNELLVAVDFIRDRNITNACHRLSSTADQIVTELLSYLQIDSVHEIEVLALGKWGGQELGFRSDLDLVLLCEDPKDPRSISTAKRLISRLNDMHRGGRIFSVDLRLRPSGAAGPLLMSNSSLLDYLRSKAAPWERQAYLRARRLKQNSQSHDIWLASIDRPLDTEEVVELRGILSRILRRPKEADGSDLDLKYVPGGLIHIEFLVQITILTNQIHDGGTDTLEMMTRLAKELPTTWGTHFEELSSHYERLRCVEQIFHLVTSHGGSRIFSSQESAHRISRALGIEARQIMDSLMLSSQRTESILGLLDPLECKI